jgi:hypothetical protein
MKETFPNDLAFARPSSHTVEYGSSSAKDGLTKREYFALMVMQGYLSGEIFRQYSRDEICEKAVKTADALIEALNKQK